MPVEVMEKKRTRTARTNNKDKAQPVEMVEQSEDEFSADELPGVSLNAQCDRLIQSWRNRYRTTVGDLMELSHIYKDAHDLLKNIPTLFEKFENACDISKGYESKWLAVGQAEHLKEEYYGMLPASITTLYYLAQMKPKQFLKEIEKPAGSRRIHAGMTRREAEDLADPEKAIEREKGSAKAKALAAKAEKERKLEEDFQKTLEEHKHHGPSSRPVNGEDTGTHHAPDPVSGATHLPQAIDPLGRESTGASAEIHAPTSQEPLIRVPGANIEPEPALVPETPAPIPAVRFADLFEWHCDDDVKPEVESASHVMLTGNFKQRYTDMKINEAVAGVKDALYKVGWKHVRVTIEMEPERAAAAN